MKLGGILREAGGGGGGGGRGHGGLKGRAPGQSKEKGSAMQARRGIMGRAARAKVWEERIEEEEEEGEELERRMCAEEVMQMGKRGGAGLLSGCKVKANEEIGVFDAERYFGGAEQQAGSWVREEEEELMEGEAGGDLPLSPLVEFGRKGKWRGYNATSAHNVMAQQLPAEEAPRAWAAGSFGRRRVESSEFTSPRTSTASSLSEVEPQRTVNFKSLQAGGKPPIKSAKLQPASPSSRLASFLAKFKPPTPRKSPASSPVIHLLTGTPPPPPRPVPPVLSPAPPKKLLHNSSVLVSPQGKAPSPRGRFLRAFSSSSADHYPSAGVSIVRQHSSLAATPSSVADSSPVSPATRSAPPDPYSPIAHSVSTTPTSARIPRTSPHSTISLPAHSYNPQSSRNKSTAASAPSRRNSVGSFKQQLPILSRKLKVYLMPERTGADQSSKQENVARSSGRGAAAGQGDLLCLRKHAPEEKQRRRWLHAEDQVVDEDIELAERLLRVVQDHQSGSAARPKPVQAMNRAADSSTHPTTYSINRGLSNHLHNSTSQGYVDRVSEYSSRKYDQMHPTAHTAANLSLSPHASAVYMTAGGAAARLGDLSLMRRDTSTKTAAKQESSLYDSDSSSDLFEIETLASVGMGLYRRDLPVYEAKEPSRSNPRGNPSFTFVSSSR